MKIALIAVGTLVVGIAIGIVFCEATIRHLRKRIKELRAGTAPVSIFRSVTKFLFVTTQAFAIIWVSWSYAIATYSTVVLFQPFPVETMSCQAIITIFGTGALKVVENIFEHNEGVVFGRRASTINTQTIPDSGGTPAATDDGEAAG